MKKWWMILLVGCSILFPALAQAQIDKLLNQFLGGAEPALRSEDLKVIQLEISPDPVRDGQRMLFRATISNSARNSGRVSIVIRDRDQIVSEVRDAILKPGDNRIDFPETAAYRFSGADHCFTVEADIERTRNRIDAAREFCANRTSAGWTLSERGVGALYVEDLEMYPDPATPGQEIRFRVKLRNDGRPMRGHIRIQDRDQVVAQIENTSIPHGFAEFQFLQGRYTFQRFDTCFTVVVDVERTPYPVDASKQYCAKPVGWSLRPVMRDQREERGR
jgi:hypothetical protein